MTKMLWLSGLALAAVVAGSAIAQAPTTATATQPPPPRVVATGGYLTQAELPNSLTLIPPPPAPGSAAQARDDATAKAMLPLRDGPRWTLATLDANLGFPAAADTFSCAIGVPISEADTPRLYSLLRRSLSDMGRSPYPTKNLYKRARPFTVNNAPVCTPALDAALRNDGSYPSGHSAIGWGWALILAEAAPDKADAVLARGRAFTESRLVCNVHWQSDIEEGRTIGAAAVTRLHDNAEFRADLAAARTEIATARAKGLKPARDCAAEAAQLAVK